LVVNTASATRQDQERFNVRRLTNFELRHDPENRDDVRVFVGYNDPDERAFFIPNAMHKKFLGNIRGRDKLEQIRAELRELGIPLIEF
jgi:hypothetical protein